MKTLISALVLLLASTVSLAASVDGNWTGSINTPTGPAQLSFLFKADGSMLTGSSTGPDGKSTMLKNGKVDGDKISFEISVDFQGTLIPFRYTGVVSDNGIKLHTDFMGQPVDFFVKKAGQG
jgi:hypothetical protein